MMSERAGGRAQVALVGSARSRFAGSVQCSTTTVRPRRLNQTASLAATIARWPQQSSPACLVAAEAAVAEEDENEADWLLCIRSPRLLGPPEAPGQRRPSRFGWVQIGRSE